MCCLGYSSFGLFVLLLPLALLLAVSNSTPYVSHKFLVLEGNFLTGSTNLTLGGGWGWGGGGM